MSRIGWLACVALVLLLGTVSWLPLSTSADTVNTINGHYDRVTPIGTGLEAIQFRQGSSIWIDSPPPMPLADLDVSQAGAFPLIMLSDPTGAPKLTILDASDPSQKAVFEYGGGNNWTPRMPAAFTTNVLLESNTIRGLDLSPFAAGGTLDLTATGVTVDARTNTATVSQGAFADFTLSAVPEPAGAVLALIGGLAGLGWLWLTRRRRAPAAA